jgi:DNA polymerase eta
VRRLYCHTYFNMLTPTSLRSLSRNDLKTKLGNETGTWLFEAVRGIDHTEIKPSTLVKSMLSCKDTIPNVETYGDAVRPHLPPFLTRGR